MNRTLTVLLPLNVIESLVTGNGAVGGVVNVWLTNRM
jgi:hypothetical protein